ncbi:MAG: histidine phosphatase family protein [Deltaproteobacteria bacterium]|nr:histidine phosphatase family protein [Deltaproteobacteria bacterium]
MPRDQRVTVYLIRHGETQWNREGRCQGVTDIPLTEKGQQQAHAIAAALAEKPLSLVLTSPLQRSYHTATTIAAPHRLAVETHDALREWHQGQLEGLTRAELLGSHRSYFQQWVQDPADVAPPGGESLQLLQTRAWAVIEQLRESNPGGAVAVVSHTMTIAAIICAALGLGLAHIHRLKIDLASISVLTYTPFGLFSSWVLSSLNDCHHLTVRPPY